MDLYNAFVQETYESTTIFSGFSGEGTSIVICRSSGILEGIRNQCTGSDQVTIKLPPNWYENEEFLGFALCCVYVRVPHEVKNRISFCCRVEIEENPSWVDVLAFGSFCDCYDDDDDDDRVSDLVWMMYYPKVAIRENCPLNQTISLSAKFFSWETYIYEVEECGIHFLYAGGVKCQPNEEC